MDVTGLPIHDDAVAPPCVSSPRSVGGGSLEPTQQDLEEELQFYLELEDLPSQIETELLIQSWTDPERDPADLTLFW